MDSLPPSHHAAAAAAKSLQSRPTLCDPIALETKIFMTHLIATFALLQWSRNKTAILPRYAVSTTEFFSPMFCPESEVDDFHMLGLNIQHRQRSTEQDKMLPVSPD